MNITYNKKTNKYILGETEYSKDDFIAYINSDMLQSVLADSSAEIDVSTSSGKDNDEPAKDGTNILYYGVPGAGKSHMIDEKINRQCSERVVFHPDYTYSDFVGQILPQVTDEKVKYIFVPGPFTRILKNAYEDPSNMYYLVIEEINRGNAPAIFGDVFQLLDRNDDGSGRFEISNSEISQVTGKSMIRIPSNLTIYATMNTSDQNVFTLDTAFQRRWNMRMIKNDVKKAHHSSDCIERSSITWGSFAEITNEEILRYADETGVSADKRLGAYFAGKNDLNRHDFPEKILKYLWDDAFRLDRSFYFNESIKSLDEIIDIFDDDVVGEDPLQKIIKGSVYDKMKS